MPQFNIKTKGFKELERAIKRNPRRVREELEDFFVDAMRIYNTGIIRSPWKVGGSGGGTPVDTGHLRDSHQREINTWQARIYVNPSRVKYATYVHEGTWRMKERPWLDYVFNNKMNEIHRRERKLYDNIIKDLAK